MAALRDATIAFARDATIEAPVDDEPEPVHGYEPEEGDADLAFVFTVGGTSYLRLTGEVDASAVGAPRRIQDGDVIAVVAPVANRGLPDALRAWNGREVMVEGVCLARVAGFAEVSRVQGEGPWSDDEEYVVDRPWTTAQIREYDKVLAARLEGDCSGTWARAKDLSVPEHATPIADDALETMAREELIANGDAVQESWTDSGGEGAWHEEADISTSAYRHELTGDTWVIVQASRGGGCGDSYVSTMAVYRKTGSGKLHRVADLARGENEVRDVVDLDGDGEPELVMGYEGSDTTMLVDLADETHAAMSGPAYAHEGCGC